MGEVYDIPQVTTESNTEGHTNDKDIWESIRYITKR
jgi:hypothetical protein